jgi:hypothetical protein
MMVTLLFLMLQEGQEPPEVVPVPALVESHAHALVDVRAGVAVLSLGSFSARTPLGLREIEDDLLAEAHLELGLDWEGWGLHLGGAAAGADDVQVRTAWLRVSTPSLFGGDIAVRLSGGVLLGSLEIDEPGFGDFEPAVGYLARLSIETPRMSSLALAAWADLRGLEFDYDEPTLSEDASIGALSFAIGLSAGLRF